MCQRIKEIIGMGGRDWQGTQKVNDFAIESKTQGKEADGEFYFLYLVKNTYLILVKRSLKKFQ